MELIQNTSELKKWIEELKIRQKKIKDLINMSTQLHGIIDEIL